MKKSLTKYHEIFSGGRCQGWQLEELIANAIKLDNHAQHHVIWQEAGHDDQADIEVRTTKDNYLLQIKSGQINKDNLVISGHRLGRFNGNLESITDYLNKINVTIMTVPYEKIDDHNGRHHCYKIRLIDNASITSLTVAGWCEKKNNNNKTILVQTNKNNVEVKIIESMSWQVWWTIPIGLFYKAGEFIIE